MDRRDFLLGVGGLTAAGLHAAPRPAGAGAEVATGHEPHFPDGLHQFVWRNWELANADRMARVLGCRPDDVLDIGRSLGLPPKRTLSADDLRRIYITVIRQNWRLLPDEQLIELLGWSPEKFRFTLAEDDFLDIKLGPKPPLPRLAYAPPGADARARAGEIRRIVQEEFGPDRDMEGEPAFEFVRRLSDRDYPMLRDPAARPWGDQVDVSGWAVLGEDPVDPIVVGRFADYLRHAMGADVGEVLDKVIRLRIDPTLGGAKDHYIVSVEDANVTVTGNRASGLLQALYGLQDQMERRGGPFLDRGRIEGTATFDPRYVYSYFALYGDPLLEADIDPFPDGYLERLGRVGINGVWLQCVLGGMAPSRTFPEFGEGSETRLATLHRLVERAGRAGMKIFLYLNEPRAMPDAFFRGREEMRGAKDGERFAICTAVPAVREWISDSLAHVFERVPGLGGVFSITMSENLTNCFSRGRQRTCPRCSKREPWEGVGEVLDAIHRGVRRASGTAEVIAYDWAWTDEISRRLIPKLPRDSRLLSVSEWEAPVERGGVRTTVGEYSMSVVGPGPRATRRWALAREAGVSTMAKTQFNNTWELSAVPYLPVAHLVARHCANLVKAGVEGIMASWTLGGYPSLNLEIAREICFAPGEDPEEVLGRLARGRYGESAAPRVVDAWRAFSEAFVEFPYGLGLYTIPTQHGPANLLRLRPTGLRGSMILFPQDDYKQWAGPYPPDVVRAQFDRLAGKWERALPPYRDALEKVPERKKPQAEEDLAIAEVCAIHFRSVANQLEFYILRDRSPASARDRERMRELVRGEIELARRLFPLARHHSVIGYEASNHYYYRPLDLAEAVLNGRYVLDHDLKGGDHG